MGTLGQISQMTNGKLIWINKCRTNDGNTTIMATNNIKDTNEQQEQQQQRPSVQPQPQPQWKQVMVQELCAPILQYSGWDVVLKVRCSIGLHVKSTLTGGRGKLISSSMLADDSNSSPELELPTITPDTSIGILFEHRVGGLPKQQHQQASSSSSSSSSSNGNNNKNLFFIQSALLYTNPYTLQRKVRVSTLALQVTSSPKIVYKSMDFGSICTF